MIFLVLSLFESMKLKQAKNKATGLTLVQALEHFQILEVLVSEVCEWVGQGFFHRQGTEPGGKWNDDSRKTAFLFLIFHIQ